MGLPPSSLWHWYVGMSLSLCLYLKVCGLFEWKKVGMVVMLFVIGMMDSPETIVWFYGNSILLLISWYVMEILFSKIGNMGGPGMIIWKLEQF